MSDFKSSNSTEFKAMGNLANGFTVVPNNVMNDIPNLGAYSFTILVKIFQYINSPSHKISIQGLATQTKFSKDRVSKSLKELIELGYIVREPKKRGNLTIGYTYLVYDTPIENTKSHRNPVMQDTELQDTATQDAKKENINHSNIKKENKVVVVTSPHTQQLISLYKSFKLEKRVMPHTVTFLKDNANKLDIDVWNEIFINASEDGITKKYQYIKATVEELAVKGIVSLEQYNNDLLDYKQSLKANKTKIFAQNGSPKSQDKPNNKWSDYEGSYKHRNYSEQELEEMINKMMI